jgi:hypothetical protein
MWVHVASASKKLRKAQPNLKKKVLLAVVVSGVVFGLIEFVLFVIIRSSRFGAAFAAVGLIAIMVTFQIGHRNLAKVVLPAEGKLLWRVLHIVQTSNRICVSITLFIVFNAVFIVLSNLNYGFYTPFSAAAETLSIGIEMLAVLSAVWVLLRYISDATGPTPSDFAKILPGATDGIGSSSQQAAHRETDVVELVSNPGLGKV